MVSQDTPVPRSVRAHRGDHRPEQLSVESPDAVVAVESGGLRGTHST